MAKQISKSVPEDLAGIEPALQQQDWDDLVAGALVAEIAPENGDIRFDVDDSAEGGVAPEEDDDNPYQESDEALPDDDDERVIERNPSKEGGLFDDV